MRVRALLLVALAIACAGTARADDRPPESRAFVDFSTPRTKVFVGEAIRLTLRVGVDAEWFRAHAAPLLARPLDVPVHVAAPDFDALPGTRRLQDVEPAAGSVRRAFAIGDAVEGKAGPSVTHGGREFTTARLERRFLVEKAGRIVVPPPRLRFAYADRFEEDDVRGRVAVDPHDAVIESRALELDAVEPPAVGRPADFRGAVGQFALRLSPDRLPAAPLEPFSLTLTLTGEGPLEEVVLPRPDEARGFHVYGVRDDRGARVRNVVYDVAALSSGVRDVPVLSLAYFDPETGTYEVARTAAIARDVSDSKAGAPLTTSEPHWRGVAAVLGGALVVGLTFVLIRRRRRETESRRG